jgi:putative membrane protein
MKTIRILSFIALSCAALGCSRHDAGARRGGLDDGQILNALVTVHHAEIAAARIARYRSTNDDVRALADRMEAEHTAAAARLRTIANDMDIERATSALSRQVTREGEDAAARLNAVAPDAFDVAYVNAMISGHRRVLSMIDRTLLPAVSAPRVRTEVNDQRTAVTSHLANAERVARELEHPGRPEPTN